MNVLRTATLLDWTEYVGFLILMFFLSCSLFYEHIQRLSKVVTANHKALQVPEVFPWTLFF